MKKKGFLALCSMVMAFVMVMPPVPALAADAYVKYTNSGRINVRSAPTAQSQRIDSLDPGTPVQVDWIEGSWAHITVNGMQGYMSMNYLEGNLYEAPNYTAADTNTYSAPTYSAPVTTYANPVSISADGQVVTDSVDSAEKLIPPIYITEDTIMYVYTGNSGGLNLREYASQNARSVGLYPNGTQVHVLSRVGSWAYVNINGNLGYMMLSYLTTTPITPSPVTPTPTGAVTMYVSTGNTGRLHLREYASQNARSLGLYPNGTRVSAVNLYNGWSYVVVNGMTGYMMTRYLTSVTPIAPTPVTPPSGSYSIMYVSTGNSGRLHLRSYMSIDSMSLGLFPNGTTVYVLANYGTWAKVNVNGLTGYMMTRYLTSIPGGSIVIPPSSGGSPIGKARVQHPNGSFVYLRSSRSTASTANVLAQVPSGAIVDIYEQDQWYSRIRYNGMIGYMVTHYLYPTSAPVPTTPPTTTPPYTPTAGTDAVVYNPNNTYVNLRYSKSTADSSNILCQVPSGAMVKLLERDGAYCKIQYNGMVGYMVATYVYKVDGGVPVVPGQPATQPPATQPPATQPPITPVGYYMVVRNMNSSFVYLRSSRSTKDNSNILASVPNGAVVKVLEKDQWYSRIIYNNIEGYMVSSYLKAE